MTDQEIFEKWAKKNAKACPKCKALIQRKDGCNHMTCVNCKYHFHWETLQKWRGYGNETNIWGNRENQIIPNEENRGFDVNRELERLRRLIW